MMARISLLIFGAVLALACGGTSVDSDHDGGTAGENGNATAGQGNTAGADANTGGGSSGAGGTGNGGAGTGSAGGGRGPLLDFATALAECDVSPARRAEATDPAAFRALAEGAWLGCPDYPHGTPPRNVAGIEFLGDGTYRVLLSDGEGGVGRGSGIDYMGEWHASEVEGSIVLVVPESEDSRWYYRPTFTEGPRALRIDEGLVLFHWSRYVPITLR